MKEENYINIQGWMISKLKLKGNELILYAIIYGFSQDGKSEFFGSMRYIAESLQVSKRTAVSLTHKLLDKKLITKNEDLKNGNKYRVVKKVVQGGEESSPLGGEESGTNNNKTNNNNIGLSKKKSATNVAKRKKNNKGFTPSSSLSRKVSLVKQNAAKNIEKLKCGRVDLVDEKEVIRPSNFDKKKTIDKMIAPYQNNKGDIVRPQKHISIIGLFILAKEIDIISDDHLKSIISRNLRASRDLKPYPFKQIMATMKFLKENADFKWKLESVSKFIDEDLAKINLNSIGKKPQGRILGEDVNIKYE